MDGSTWLEGFQFSGHDVTFIGGESVRHVERVRGEVVQYNLTTGRRTFRVIYNGEYGSGPDGEVRSAFASGEPPVVVAAPDGAAAWVVENAEECTSVCSSNREESVVVHDRDGTRTVARYVVPNPEHDFIPLQVTQLAWAGDFVTWSHLGASASARL